MALHFDFRRDDVGRCIKRPLRLQAGIGDVAVGADKVELARPGPALQVDQHVPGSAGRLPFQPFLPNQVKRAFHRQLDFDDVAAA